MNPEVSIIMPAYNAAPFIGESIRSCLRQKGCFDTPYELIVVNDGSTDRTAEALDNWKKFAGSFGQLHVIETDNGGVAKAVNTGLEHARGKYSIFMDSDDILTYDALAQLYDLIHKKRSPLVVGQHAGFDSSSKRVLFVTDKQKFFVLGNDPTDEPLLHAFGVGHPKIVNTQQARNIGGFEPTTGFASDLDFVLKLLFPGEIKQWGLVDKVLYWYRVHNSNSVMNRSEQINGAISALDVALKRLGVTGKVFSTGRNSTGLLSYSWK
jgi:glycosyltransferase involved in cell wall biosynthesis